MPVGKTVYPEPYWGFDLNETEKEYVFCIEAPGFEANEFNLTVAGDLLTLCAEHKVATGAKNVPELTCAERHFERRVNLPAAVLPEKIEAVYKNGILEIHVPKSEEAKARRIMVKG